MIAAMGFASIPWLAITLLLVPVQLAPPRTAKVTLGTNRPASPSSAPLRAQPGCPSALTCCSPGAFGVVVGHRRTARG